MAVPLPPDGPVPPVAGPNPLENLTNDGTWYAALMLHAACGRNKSVLRGKHREHLCYLANLLDLERENRGLAACLPPYSVNRTPPPPPT